MRPGGANGPTLDQCLEDDSGTVGSESSVPVGGMRNGSLSSRERRLNRRNGGVNKEEEDGKLRGGDSGEEGDSDSGAAEDPLRESPVGLNVRYSTLPHYSLDRSKTTNGLPPPPPLSPTSSSETVSHMLKVAWCT